MTLADGRRLRGLHGYGSKRSIEADAILSLDPVAADIARSRALQMEIGEKNHEKLLEYFDKAIGKKTEEWVLIGGPPCQAYSIIGRSRNRGKPGYLPKEDKRHYLYQNYLQLIADRAPSVFVMENVKGILSSTVGDERIFESIVRDLQNPGVATGQTRRGARYKIHCITSYGRAFKEDDPRRFIIKSECHGVPQMRHRVILIGVRDGLESPGLLRSASDMKTISDAIDDLPGLSSYLSGRGGACRSDEISETIQSFMEPIVKNCPHGLKGVLRERLYELSGVDFPVVKSVRFDQETDIWNHSSRGHMPSDLARYLYAAVFAEVKGYSPSIADFPKKLWPKHANLAGTDGRGTFSDRFRVQVSDRPSSTITSHISKDGHYYIHYDPNQCRSLSVREAARIQTFPDNYIFCGPRTSQFVQVGNAVPPQLARLIAGSVAQCFS